MAIKKRPLIWQKDKARSPYSGPSAQKARSLLAMVSRDMNF
jgi:hypothetical protein